MSKGLCGLQGWSTTKSAMTKVKGRQHFNFIMFMSNLRFDPLDMEWYTWLHIVYGHVIRMLDSGTSGVDQCGGRASGVISQYFSFLGV